MNRFGHNSIPGSECVPVYFSYEVDRVLNCVSNCLLHTSISLPSPSPSLVLSPSSPFHEQKQTNGARASSETVPLALPPAGESSDEGSHPSWKHPVRILENHFKDLWAITSILKTLKTRFIQDPFEGSFRTVLVVLFQQRITSMMMMTSIRYSSIGFFFKDRFW